MPPSYDTRACYVCTFIKVINVIITLLTLNTLNVNCCNAVFYFEVQPIDGVLVDIKWIQQFWINDFLVIPVSLIVIIIMDLKNSSQSGFPNESNECNNISVGV